MKQVVIIPGGYHPFHSGHYALYQSAKDAFPNATVYIAATDDTKTRPFPFKVKQKLAQLSGVAPKYFVQVSNPFKATEITSKYDPNTDVLIFVRSEKDKSEYPIPDRTLKDGSKGYFRTWTGKGVESFGKVGYMAYLPTIQFGPGITSASEIRNAWPRLSDKQKLAMVMSLYPATRQNTQLAHQVVKIFDSVILGEPSSSALAESQSKKIKIKEGNMKLSALFENDGEKADAGADDITRAAINATADENEVLAFIRRHYPEAPNTQAAFIKFVIHSLQHSEEDSIQHATEIESLKRELNRLEKKVTDLVQRQQNNEL